MSKMERLSEGAIEILNELHTERLDCASPLIEAAQQLQAYEDMGPTPDQVWELLRAYGLNEGPHYE